MTDKKKEISKEIKGYIKNFSILFLSGIPLYYGLSIAKSIFNIENERLIWLIDLGFYNLIFSLIVAIILFLISIKRTNLEISLYYSEDKLSKVTLENDKKKTIHLGITVKGNRSNIPDRITLHYPDWLDLQLKGAEYITAEDSLNQYYFDLQKMFNQQKEIDLTKIIPIDITGYSDAMNKIKIIPELTKIEPKIRFFTSIKLQGLKINLKGN
ncbi:hypothetical protein [Paenisporosarcina sp. TG-14]|uniref:hypothetical protein n=1 Tax=Paenisporosarcina sp. TG-14 TaxID=1231057 RepID=UPI0002D2D57B|nr:hypothetical protein [Paenisporosarcina sp. TG-14]